jgi:HEAT repeat protein
MRVFVAIILCLAVAAIAGVAAAQTTAPPTTTTTTTTATTTTTTTAAAPTLPDGRLDFGVEGLIFPPIVILNGHTPRSAELLGAAYRRQEPLVWKRTQLVADIGEVRQAAGAPYLIDAMKDAAPQVRAEAARAAGKVGDASLLPHVEKLLGDADASVRREAVLAAAKLAREQKQSTTAIVRGLGDVQPPVVAAALQAAWTVQDAAQIAQKLPSLPRELKAEAALALARLKAADHAPAMLPMLGSDDVAQRVAAVRVLGEIGKPAQLDAVSKMLADAHPTVRRAAVLAIGKLDADVTRKPTAVKMLGDADPTVREAAARVLTPVATSEALTAIAHQLDVDYAPLHEATRAALIRPANDAIRAAVIALAADMLAHANPRRQEDASYVLGRLRSDAAIDRHVAMLNWDPANPAKHDWLVIAQAAESTGMIGDPRATDELMAIVKVAPDAMAGLQRPQQDHMGRAMANALVAAARLRHRPALAEASRILQLNPETCPVDLRAASAFAIGVLTEPGGAPPAEVNFFAIYASPFEGRAAKIEALKALGNMRHAASAQRLKELSVVDPTPYLRWFAHWSYERCANTRVPYTPPAEARATPVSISDLPKNQP